MLNEQPGSGKFKIYKDADADKLLSIKGDTILETGYIYAPYIPIMTTPGFMSPKQIKEETRIPIKVVKAALNQAGYKINRDFTISTDPFAATIVITAKPGRRFTESGQCRASTMRKGKLSITWTYDPSNGIGGKASKNVDVSLADPGCFQQIAETIVTAVKESSWKPQTGIFSRYGYNKRVNTSYYGKATI